MKQRLKGAKFTQEHTRTGSTKGYFHKHGQYFALPSKSIQPKPYQMPKKFTGESSYRSSFKPQTTKKGKKPLVKYNPNCPQRSNYKPDFSALRDKKRKHNVSQIVFGNSANDRTRFRTTNKVHFDQKQTLVPTGFANQGIISEKTSWIHKRQED